MKLRKPGWAILALGVAFLLALGTCSPLVDTFAVAGVRTAGLDYGRMRLWGSITFIAATSRFGPRMKLAHCFLAHHISAHFRPGIPSR